MELYDVQNLIIQQKLNVANYANYKHHEIELVNINLYYDYMFDISVEHNKLKELVIKHTKGLYNVVILYKNKIVKDLWFAKFNIQMKDGNEIYSINLDTNCASELFYVRPLDFLVVDDSEKILTAIKNNTMKLDRIICKFFHE